MDALEFMKSANPQYIKVPGEDKKYEFSTGDDAGLFSLFIYRRGVDKYENWCGPVDHRDSLTTATNEGGYNKVYQICDELKKVLKSGTIQDDIEVRYDNSGYTYEYGQKIVHMIMPRKPMQYTVNFIVNNSINNSTVSNSTVQSTVTNSNVTNSAFIKNEKTHQINKALKIAVNDWKVTPVNDAYKLFPHNCTCCVDNKTVHADDMNHSWITVRKLSVTAHCLSHGNRAIIGEKSRSIRELFFEFKRNAGPSREAVELVLSAAESESLVRHGGQVFKGFKPISSYEEFVQKALKSQEAQKNFPRLVFSDLATFMEKADDDRFPFAKRDRRYIGFSNGLLDIVEGELVEGERNVIPRHCIDQPFSAEDIETPLFDRFIRHQIEDDDVFIYLLGLIGRLLYDVRQFDEFDVIPVVIGDTNTGKSTLAHIIRTMFDPCSVGTLDSKHEVIFGLSSLYQKEVLIATEINDKMVNQLSSDTFKNMVCGDTVSISRKYKEPIFVQWKVPIFLCGNQHISYRDEKGSVSRRLAIFKFEKYVDEIDGSLKDTIIENELSKIITKCLLAYRMLLKKSRLGFWKACPEYFKENRDDLNQETDYIYKFLSLGPDDNVWGSRYLYFIKVPGSTMLLEDFKNKFFNWLRFKHQNVKYKWTNDYSAFKRKGFEVVRTKICKVCHQEARKGCCDYYDPDNRTTRVTIKDIRCIDEEAGD